MVRKNPYFVNLMLSFPWASECRWDGMQFRFDMMVKTPGNFTRLRESLSRAQVEKKKRWADIEI